MTLKRLFSPLDSKRSSRRGLWAVLILALALRVPVAAAIALEPERAITGSDAEQYLALANNLADEGVFSRESAPPYTPEVFRTPGYPAFLLPFVLIFGERPLLPIVIAQVIVSVLTVWGTICLARRLFDERIGLWAGLLIAVMPITILMTGAIYAETVFAALLVGAGWLLVDSLERDRFALSAAAGLVLGIAALVRPIGLPMIALWAILPLTKRSLPVLAGLGGRFKFAVLQRCQQRSPPIRYPARRGTGEALRTGRSAPADRRQLAGQRRRDGCAACDRREPGGVCVV